jgi:hypothetical protein
MEERAWGEEAFILSSINWTNPCQSDQIKVNPTESD